MKCKDVALVLYERLASDVVENLPNTSLQILSTLLPEELLIFYALCLYFALNPGMIQILVCTVIWSF
jgi:hypothetical protein